MTLEGQLSSLREDNESLKCSIAAKVILELEELQKHAKNHPGFNSNIQFNYFTARNRYHRNEII